MKSAKFKRVWRGVRAVASALVLLAIGAQGITADPLQPQHRRNTVAGGAFIHGQLQVAQGNEAEARAYYRDVVASQMHFMTASTIETSSIKDLLAYFGYGDINARDLHRLTSEELMALSAAGNILATVFFAPKISQVETPAPAQPAAFGWRKLSRFKATPGSSAANNGMETLYFLQNIFEKSTTAAPTPEKNVSLFNQAIVARKVGSGPYSPSKRAIYFFAYDSLVKCAGPGGEPKSCEANEAPILVGGQFQDDGALGFKLKASFESRNPETEAAGKDFFYVPRSCQDCHGKSISNGKVNFLDTDHWRDRVKPNYGLADARFSLEDFTALTQPVLLDGGVDASAAQFREAFAIIRSLNEEIRLQNADAPINQDPDAQANFSLRAVTKWLELHNAGGADPTRHVPPFQRGFGAQPWNPANEKERTLLYYLNRYCYRCHSSIKYNVFERKDVLRLKGDILDRVTELSDDTLWMPQDRVFPGLEQTAGVATPTGDLKEFLDLLQQLQ